KNIPKGASVLALSSNVGIGGKYGGFLITVENKVVQTSVHVDESVRDVENLKIESNPDQSIGGIKVTQGVSSVTFAGAIGTISSDGNLKISSEKDFTVGKINVAGEGSYIVGGEFDDHITGAWSIGDKKNPIISYTGMNSELKIDQNGRLDHVKIVRTNLKNPIDGTLIYKGISIQPVGPKAVTAYFNAKPPKFVLPDKGTGAVFVTKNSNTQNFNIESLGYAGFSVGKKDQPDYLSWVGMDDGNHIIAKRDYTKKVQDITFQDFAETSNTVGEVGLGAGKYVIGKVDGRFGVRSSVFGLASRIDYPTTFNFVKNDGQPQRFALFPSGTIKTGGPPESDGSKGIVRVGITPPAPVATITTPSIQPIPPSEIKPLDPLLAAGERLHAVKRYVITSRNNHEKEMLVQELNKINEQMGAWVKTGGTEEQKNRQTQYNK
ncbi:MAG: hypothetical protein AABX52_03665, partial [Nanoarchaeota archaeon]